MQVSLKKKPCYTKMDGGCLTIMNSERVLIKVLLQINMCKNLLKDTQTHLNRFYFLHGHFFELEQMIGEWTVMDEQF